MIFAGMIILGILAYVGLVKYKKKNDDSSFQQKQNGNILP
jgi:hypothetical protein